MKRENVDGNSAYSEEKQVTTLCQDAAPAVPILRGAVKGKNMASITFEPVKNAIAYKVKYGTNPENLNQVEYIDKAFVQQHIITGLDNDKNYYFKICSVGRDSNKQEVDSAYSEPVKLDLSGDIAIEGITAKLAEDTFEFLPKQTTKTIQLQAISSKLQTQDVQYSIELPAGFETENNEGTLTVASQKTETIPIEIRKEDSLEPGTYTAIMKVNTGNETDYSFNITLKVPKYTELDQDSFDEDTLSNKWTTSTGEWKIDNNVLQGSSLGGTKSSSITFGSNEWSDYLVTTQIKRGKTLSGADGYSAGLIFRYQDDKNYYHARLNESWGSKSVQLYKWVDGKAVSIGSAAYSFDYDKWYDLTVDVNGNQIVVYVDGEKVLQAVDDTYQKGQVGYRIYGGEVQFENLGVYTKETVPEGNTPEGNTPEGNTPEENTPGGNTPEGNTPEGNTPEENTPEENTPEENTPESNTPNSNTSSSNTSNNSSSTHKGQSSISAQNYINQLSSQKKESIKVQAEQKMPYTSLTGEIPFDVLKKLTNNELSDSEIKVLQKDPELIEKMGIDISSLVKVENIVPTTLEKNFKDVSNNHWANKDIMAATQLGIVKGMPDGTFQPNTPLKVKDTFTFLDRVMLLNGVEDMKQSRETVEKYITNKDDWSYYSVASIASKLDESTIYSIAQLNDNNISRQMVAQVMYELVRDKVKAVNKPVEFTDISQSKYKETIEYCTSLGLLKGVGDNKFEPDRTITRAEMISIAIRMNDLLKKNLNED